MKAICQSGYGQTVLTLLKDENTPLFFRIQRKNMLNYGEIIQGKIIQKNETLRGYFVETSKGLSVFVPSREKYAMGESVYVQITKEARLGKDATGKIQTKNPVPGMPDITKEIANIASCIEQDTSNLTDEFIEEALCSSVLFAKGALLNVERTQTCWCIDIDSGSSELPLSEINEAACTVIYNQIMLKNMSGIIVVDFAGFKNISEQKQLENQLKKLFAKHTEITVYGFTKTKLFEIKRNRTTAALIDLFQTPDGHTHPLAMVPRIMRLLIQNKNGKSILIIHPALLSYLPKNINMYCTIRQDLNIPIDYYEIKENE